MKKIVALFFIILIVSNSYSNNFFCSQYIAKDITLDFKNKDFYYFPLPTTIDHDRDNIFILDAQDNEIKVFSKSGDFKYSIGRKGQGPGEFNLPSDMDIFGDKIYVSDKINRRIQIIDKKGNYIGGFKVLFYPQKILVLGKNNILASHLPLRPSGKEKIIHCFNGNGKLLWESVDSCFSRDSIFDFFLNQVFLELGESEKFFLIRMFNDRNISLYNSKGELEKKIKVTEEYPLKKISVPTKKNRKKELAGLCWDSALYHDKFFLLMSEYSKEEEDLIPGKQIAIINMEGKIHGFIDLPDNLKLFCVDKTMIYGIDTENNLRILKIIKE